MQNCPIRINSCTHLILVVYSSVYSCIKLLIFLLMYSTEAELMEFAIISMEINFNKVLYRQIDGIAMGCTFRPTRINIFVVFFFSKIYLLILNDWGIMLMPPLVCLQMKLRLGFSMRHLIHCYGVLPFLNVIVNGLNTGSLISMKPTFMGLYKMWASFSSKQMKINFVKTLVDWALIIYLAIKLNL